jgi:hypothetical protein
MRKTLALFLLLCVTTAAHALGADPWRDWRTADSPHFRIHYRVEQRAVAERVAAIAERVYPRITEQLAWEPRGQTEIVLFSEFDLTNGYSTPIPFDTIGIYLAPPDEGELLDNSAWLDLLVTHEFTHIVHLDKVRGAPRVLQWIFGRIPYFFPNAWQPLWAIEGIAVLNESDPDAGRGRLYGPLFEGWLRAERAAGFISLAEINANGRALPLSKQYIYGAYFYDYLARVYGKDAVFKYIDRYSGNIVPRVHTNPVVATGKTMDVLWSDFLADLAAGVDQRSAAIRREPENTGASLLPVQWSIDGLAPAPDGAVYALVDDGITRPHLKQIESSGNVTQLAGLNYGARIDARGDDAVLVTQPEICDNRSLFFDLYLYTRADGLKRLTECARLRRAVFAGEHYLALKNDAGVTSVVRVSRDGRDMRILYAPGPDTELVDLAATGDGKRALIVQKEAGSWSLVEFEVGEVQASPTTRLMLEGPVFSPRYVAGGAVQFIASRDGAYNVWRHESGSAQALRLTHTYTAVIAQAQGTDGALTVAVLAHQGMEVHRQGASATLAQMPAGPSPRATAAPASPPVQEETAPALKDERTYLAARSLYPRGWLPAAYADRGLTAFGASIFGSDALAWHQYALTAMWETSQNEPIGSLEYILYDRHFFALTRELSPLAWTGKSGDETTTVYERRTSGQWISTLPWLRIEHRLTLGVGAGIDRTDQVVVDGASTRPSDKKVAAAYIDYDTRNANWLSEGINRGVRGSLLYETYKPFSSDFDGSVLRFDGEGYLPLGRSVLAARLVEIHADGNTERYQLGGAIMQLPLAVPKLNERDVPLRGYRGNEAELRGRNARLATVEFRTPIMDIDRHAMVPPIGINRLSANVFFDIGAAWDGGSPSKYYRGVGAELLGEVKLLYLFALQTRVGVAVGLDGPGTTRVYAALGRQF